MWNESFMSTLTLVVMAVLLRMVYELSRPNQRETSYLLSAIVDSNPPTAALTPLQKEWSEKAVKKYAEAQEKKWRKWNDAMFETMK